MLTISGREGGIEEVSNLVTLTSDQTITGAKTFSTGTNFSTIAVSSTSTHGDTATFTKSNGRAIEVKTGTTLNGWFSGSGELHATKFSQSGSGANSFTGDISTSRSLTVATTTQLNGTLTVGTGSSKTTINTSGTVATTNLSATKTMSDVLQLTNLTGLSQFPGSPVVGDVAMFAGILYYYGTGNTWYMFSVSTHTPPA